MYDLAASCNIKFGCVISQKQQSVTNFMSHRAVQWHYIDKLSNYTVPNHTFITTYHQALFIYNQTKIMDDFQCFCSEMCFHTFSTVPLNSPDAYGLQFKYPYL